MRDAQSEQFKALRTCSLGRARGRGGQVRGSQTWFSAVDQHVVEELAVEQLHESVIPERCGGALQPEHEVCAAGDSASVGGCGSRGAGGSDDVPLTADARLASDFRGVRSARAGWGRTGARQHSVCQAEGRHHRCRHRRRRPSAASGQQHVTFSSFKCSCWPVLLAGLFELVMAACTSTRIRTY